jgi:hypothetical protein
LSVWKLIEKVHYIFGVIVVCSSVAIKLREVFGGGGQGQDVIDEGRRTLSQDSLFWMDLINYCFSLSEPHIFLFEVRRRRIDGVKEKAFYGESPIHSFLHLLDCLIILLLHNCIVWSPINQIE